MADHDNVRLTREIFSSIFSLTARTSCGRPIADRDCRPVSAQFAPGAEPANQYHQP